MPSQRFESSVTSISWIPSEAVTGLNRAIFATGWDGSVIVTAKSDGTYRVQTER